jgi:hypothetical protein
VECRCGEDTEVASIINVVWGGIHNEPEYLYCCTLEVTEYVYHEPKGDERDDNEELNKWETIASSGI